MRSRLNKEWERHVAQLMPWSTCNLLRDPQQWRDRAEEMRGLVKRSVHVEAKRTLETIVAEYELLARRAEQRLRGNKLDDC